MVPTWTGKTGKPGKMRNLFPVGKKSVNFELTGKVREFYPKYWQSEDILASFYFKFFLLLFNGSVFVNRFLYLLTSLNETMENRKKILEKSGKFVSPKMWEPCN